MGTFGCIPLFEDITNIVANQKLSTMYCGCHFDKNLLILKYDYLTLMVVLKESDQGLITELIKVVSSGDKIIKGGIKIVGNKNIILLLDDDGKIWRLINAFEFSRESDYCFYMIGNKSFYEWIPFDTFRFQTVLAVSSFGEGFACIGITENCKKQLKILSSFEPPDLEDHSFDDLKMKNFLCDYMQNIKINTYESLFKEELGHASEVLIVPEKVSGKVYICSKGGKHCVVTGSGDSLLTLINFEKETCLLLIFRCGKLVFIFYNKSVNCKSVSKVSYLFGKLISAQQCTCSQNCFVWSDGINLYHSKVKFEFDKQCIVSLEHLQINQFVKGIVFVLNFSKGLICVTINHFYYYISIGEFIRLRRYKKLSIEFLNEVHQSSLQVTKLNEEMKIYKEFLRNKEMIQKVDLNQMGLQVEAMASCIFIKNFSNATLSKDFWKIMVVEMAENKKFSEIIDLEMNLSQGATVNIQTDLDLNNEINICLVGHFGNKLIFFKMKNFKQEKQVKAVNEINKFLYEMIKNIKHLQCN